MKLEDFSYTTEEQIPGNIKVTFTIPATTVRKTYTQALEHAKGSVKMAGFRPGKVPESIIDRKYGNILKTNTRDHLVKTASALALDTKELRPFSQYEVLSVGDLSPTEPLEYTIEFDLYPEFTIPALNSCTITHEPISVSDAEVEARLENFRNSVAQLELVSGPATATSYVRVSAIAEGDEAPENTHLNISTTWINLAEPATYPGSDKYLIGRSKGDIIPATITFGDNCPDESLRGRTVDICFTILDVHSFVVPEIDDALAKRCGLNTLVELTSMIRKEIITMKKADRRARAQESVITQLTNNLDVRLPPKSFDKEVEQELARIKKVEEKKSEDERLLDNIISERAVANVTVRMRRGFLLQTVVEQNDITASQEELHAEIVKMAQQWNMSPEDLCRQVNTKFFGDLAQRITFTKATNLIVSKAKVLDPDGVLYDPMMPLELPELETIPMHDGELHTSGFLQVESEMPEPCEPVFIDESISDEPAPSIIHYDDLPFLPASVEEIKTHPVAGTCEGTFMDEIVHT